MYDSEKVMHKPN